MKIEDKANMRNVRLSAKFDRKWLFWVLGEKVSSNIYPWQGLKVRIQETEVRSQEIAEF